MTIPHFPSKCTHTHTAVNTHTEQWAAIYAAAPGEQLGVQCLAQGHLIVVLNVERALYLHSPHWQFLTDRDSNSQPLDYVLDSLPLGYDFPRSSCCGNSLPFLVISGRPDIWTFGLSCAVQKYVIQNCEWFTLKTQMVLAGSFFMLPNNTQSKSPYMTVIFFISASKRTKQHISSASFDRFWDGAHSVWARKELLFQSCTEYMRGSCKINPLSQWKPPF